MAIIGVKCCYHNGNSVGKVTSVSVSYDKMRLSKLQQNRYRTLGANVSLVSSGGYSASVFNTSGYLRWVVPEQNNGVRQLRVYELPNVVLEEPDISAVSKQDNITFTTFSISGKSWRCPDGLRTTIATDDSDALSKAQGGWA